MLARGDNPQMVLEVLAQGLTNKFLHHPMTALKKVSADEREALTEALQKLYPEQSDVPSKQHPTATGEEK
jgi:glutamyl-tRNA reductase